MSMVPLVEKAGVPFISLAGAVVVIEPVKKFVFKTPHTDRMAAEKVFDDMKKRGISKVALLSETSGFGQSGRKETEGVAAKYGITLVANETYGPTAHKNSQHGWRRGGVCVRSGTGASAGNQRLQAARHHSAAVPRARCGI
jgi:ABC-type branched-subunit amino acid transport system substrate-binding protein